MSQYCRKFENRLSDMVETRLLSFFEIPYFHVVLSLKANGAISPLLHTHSQSSQIQLYLTCVCWSF